MAAPVVASSRSPFVTEVTAGSHRWTMDEPATAGGTDRGPTPYDMLAAALAGCTAMTVQFYARREGLPLETVTVAITHDRQHAKDCADCMTKSGYIHRLRVDLTLSGALSAEQRERLLVVAGRCPVSKTLESEIRVEHHLVGASGE